MLQIQLPGQSLLTFLVNKRAEVLGWNNDLMTKRISWFSRKPWFNSQLLHGSPIICYLNSRGSNASTEHLVVHGHIGGKTLSNTHRNQNNKISEIKYLLLKTLNINSNSSIKVHRLKDYWTGKQNLPFYCTQEIYPTSG